MNKIKINLKVNNVPLEKEIDANVILADFIRYRFKIIKKVLYFFTDHTSLAQAQAILPLILKCCYKTNSY